MADPLPSAPLAPNLELIATVAAKGQSYSYWERLDVERVVGQVLSTATMEVAELSRDIDGWENLKLACYDPATVSLAGELCITGIVDVRQVFYDAHNHGVQIRVASKTQDMAASTVDGKPGQYRNYTFAQIGQAVAKPVGIGVKIIGNPKGADTPFARISEHIGETRIAFLERLARWRNLHYVDDGQGNLNFFRADSGAGGHLADLVEGQNILTCRSIMRIDQSMAIATMSTQQPGSNTTWGPDAAQVTASAKNPNNKSKRTVTMAGEIADGPAGAQMRANHEINTSNLFAFEVIATVGGWLAPDGKLWILHVTTGEAISIYSPSIMPLGSQSATLYLKGAKHIQDSRRGTITELRLCLKQGLGGTSIAGETPPGV